MVNFLARNIIDGKITWNQIADSNKYFKYKDKILEVLESQGYMIDEDGNCIYIS